MDSTDDIKKTIEGIIKQFNPVQKSEAQKKLTDAGLPKKYTTVNDIEVLRKILAMVS